MGDLGQYVRLKRIEKNLSQRELAKAIGLSHSALAMIERGERTDLRADTVRRLARGLEIGEGELLDHLELVSA